MKISKPLLAFCAFTACGMQYASAGTIPFFSSPGVIDTTKWYLSNGWKDGNIQSCVWLKNHITVDQTNLKITLDNNNNGSTVASYGCGEVQSISKQSYGLYEVRMKTAKGSGLNSTFFTYTGSPTHDEIDFEFLDKNTSTVQLNYFVGGVNTGGVNINLGFDSSADYHNYAFAWLPKQIIWYVDGKIVRQTASGVKIPSNLSKMYFSLWSGSNSVTWVKNWLGAFSYAGPYAAEYAWVNYTPMTTVPATVTTTVNPDPIPLRLNPSSPSGR